jgi:hypothetical protein
LAQQQAVDATLTAMAPTLTPTPRPTDTPRPTPTPRVTNTPRPTPTARPTDTPYPTYTPYPTNTPYPTPTPLPPPTYTPQPTYTPPPTNTSLPPPPPSGDSALASELRARTRSSWVANPYTYEADRFIADLTGRLGQFQLPHLGVTQSTMTDALRRGGAEDRLNALVGRVWGDWMNNEVNPKGYDAYSTDPGVTDMSPLRLLVIRMIQGRQGALVDSQQHALHNFFTREEKGSVWVENVNGVIAAVNRESFQWQ